MEWLNYHHLYYFWHVAREGSVAAASRQLHVGRPAISMQLKSLEKFVGSPLFHRRGRHMELTQTGETVLTYADDIFATGRELVDVLRGRPTGRPQRFRIGIADVMAKIVAFQLLLPALDADSQTVLECREDEPQRLFAQLAVHELDLVLSDMPMAPGLDVSAFNHVVGESNTTLFATRELAEQLRPGFPDSLDGAPFLMPSTTAAIRKSLEHWLEQRDLRPSVVAEFEDAALMKVFGQAGRGAFSGPTVVAAQICANYSVVPIGVLEGVRERYYAISPERKIRHPGVVRIVESAKEGIFAGGAAS
jgi:LysR family transcriptional activator of nhaA